MFENFCKKMEKLDVKYCFKSQEPHPSFCTWAFSQNGFSQFNPLVHNVPKRSDTLQVKTLQEITNISIKLRITTICCLHLNFVDCEYFLELNSPDILAICEINLDDSIDSHNFSERGCLPLIQKDSTHMHCLALYMKDGLPFAQNLVLENSADCQCFRLALLYSVSYFFFLYQ